MPVSVVIPVFNHIQVVKKYLEINLQHAAGKVEWIVIDNNSDQPTKQGLQHFKQQCEAKGHQFVLITEPENTGVGRPWNKGIKLATNPIVCILNNDCCLSPNWDLEFEKIIKQKRADIFTPLIIEKNLVKPQATLESFLEGKHNYNYYIKKNKNRQREDIFVGVVIVGLKTTFETVGMFDERFWVGLEETDFLVRAYAQNYKIMVIGNIVGYHHSQLTSSKIRNPESEQKNKQLFIEKHGWSWGKQRTTLRNKITRKLQKRFLKYFHILLNISFKYPISKTPQ